MPSTKVFAAVLAALAMPMVNAGPCKPVQPVTTSGSTDAIITTTGLTTGGTEAATGTTEIVATTTADAACTHFTPLVLQPADCGRKGYAANGEGKMIGLPVTAENSADCGNKCGMTVGCKSFSHISTTCSLFNAPVSELGFTPSQQSMTALFYDLENCFGCGDEHTATSGIETATSGAQTGTSGAETATSGAETGTGSETATSAAETATSGVETATGSATSGTETATVPATSGSETATSAAETAATSGTETGTAPATDISATSGAQTDTTTAAAAGTTETSETEALTNSAATTTAAAATTTSDAACTAYTLVPNAPPANCAKKGKAITPQIIETKTVEDLDACSLSCGNYVNQLLPGSVICKSFSFKASTNTCTLYKATIGEMNVVTCSIADEQDFYDFDACYTCQEGGASTTEAATTTAQSAGTTEAAGTTTDESTDSATSVETGAATTETGVTTVDTTAAESAGTTTAAETDSATSVETGATTVDTTAAESAGTTTTAAESAGTTTAAVSDSATTETGATTADTTVAESAGTTTADTTAAESAGTTTAAESAGTTTAVESVGTTTAAESVGTTTAAESVGTTTAAESVGTTTAAESIGTTTAAESVGTTTAAESAGTTTAAESIGTTTTGEAAGTTTTAESASEAVTTTSADAGVSTTAAETTTAAESTTEGITTTTEAATTTAEPTTTTAAAPVCTNYIIKPNAPSSCGKQGKVSCRSSQKLGQPTTSESSDACGKTCGNTDGCKAFSWTYKLRSLSTCQLYSAPLSELSFTPCNTGTKFYDLDTCFTCSNTPTTNPPVTNPPTTNPNPPATCSKYVPAFETCSKDTHCGTRGEICNETRIYTTVDSSCLENCAKSCIQYGAECKYFSYKAADMFGAAKCKLYKAGKITYKSWSSTKFYEQKCFKCKETTTAPQVSKKFAVN
ncbi:hypothetical protein ACHAQD_006903 [Fusarium lateritium]